MHLLVQTQTPLLTLLGRLISALASISNVTSDVRPPKTADLRAVMPLCYSIAEVIDIVRFQIVNMTKSTSQVTFRNVISINTVNFLQ
jgi:hypothetical protein